MKTSLARERVEERRAREQYRDRERLERRRHVHAVHAVQDLLRDAGVRHALEPSAGHVPEAGLGDVSQARLRRIIQPEREEQTGKQREPRDERRVGRAEERGLQERDHG